MGGMVHPMKEQKTIKKNIAQAWGHGPTNQGKRKKKNWPGW